MPLRKRAAAAVKPSTGGRSKRQKITKPVTECEKAVVDLTAQNAVQSPLLRLPMELHNVVWNLAFGDRAIGVEARYPREGDEVPEVDYHAYESIPEYGIYSGITAQVPQLVCKQYWSEVSEIFFCSCTFVFDEFDAFLGSVCSPHKILAQVRKTRIIITLEHTRYHREKISQTFSTSAVGELRRLEGVDLDIHYWHPINSNMQSSKIMDNAVWNRLRLPVVIRGFQQHKLKEALTRVVIGPGHYGHEDDRGRAAAAASMRACLLDHHPRRFSKRGKEDWVPSRVWLDSLE